MSNILSDLIKSILILSFAISQTRYKDEIFSDVVKTEDVVYGNAPDIPFNFAFEFFTEDIDLTMDIYEGDGDTLTNRPVIIFMHSGAFFEGSHEADDMVSLSNTSARMGYVAVSIAYRLGYNVFSSYSAERAIYRGVQDLSAAVRYLREHHLDYRIDYNNIFIWGSSAGAFSGIHLSYMEEEDRMESTFVNNWGWDPDLGCIDCSGNDFNHDRKPKAVVGCWGGIFDLDWINEGDEIPLIMFHGVEDSIVQFNEGYPFTKAYLLPWLYGSNLVHNRLDSLNIDSELHAAEGMPHEYWGTFSGNWLEDGPNENFAIIKEEAYSFLYDILYPFQLEIVKDELAMPRAFALHQNYPNPFNPTTLIKYDLPEAKNVQVTIYDIMGRKVRTLVNEFQDIGYRTIQWNAADDYGRPVSAGMYIYTIQAGDFRQIKKMVLLK